MKDRAVIFDIDGTALDSPVHKVPTERLTRAIRSIETTYYVSAATGRVWSFARPVLEALDLIDPCVISGGTQICNPRTGEILWQCNVEQADIQKAVEIVKQYPDYKVLYNDHTDDDYLHGGINPASLVISGPVYFFNQKFVPQDKAPEIVEQLSRIQGIACTCLVSQLPGFNDIHVTNKNATKEHAIAELLKILGIKKEDTIGVGDGHNDIHLFNAVKHKVAVSNAVSDLKEKADEIIGDVKDDGFAAYLELLNSH